MYSTDKYKSATKEDVDDKSFLYFGVDESLFSFQMLLLGLILCCGSAVVHALKPNVVVCSVARIASGTSYAIVYATLLVKLVFLVSLNGGVYLPATYQSLLLCFAILIQVSINL